MIKFNLKGLDAIRREFARLVPAAKQQVLNDVARKEWCNDRIP